MKKNPLTQGKLMENSTGIGTVTRKMVRKRATELAMISGSTSQGLSKSDLAQARRELTGGSDIDPQTAILESVPESERAEPIPSSTGHKAPKSSDEDEDGEGRSQSAKLVEQGVEEAEHDQMLRAAQIKLP